MRNRAEAVVAGPLVGNPGGSAPAGARAARRSAGGRRTRVVADPARRCAARLRRRGRDIAAPRVLDCGRGVAEVAFLHALSRTLLLCDGSFNL